MKRAVLITIVGIVLIILGIGVSFLGRRTAKRYTGPVETIRLGTPSLGLEQSELIWIAEDQGYFVSNGLDVVITFPPSTLEIYQKLNNGVLDLLVTSEYSFLASLSGTDTSKAKIVAVIDKAKSVKVIARKDRGISQPADLKGKKIAVFKNTLIEFFLDTFLVFNNLTFEDVRLVDLPPDKAKDALLEGVVDAAVISQPYASQAEEALVKNAVSWSAQGDVELNYTLASSDLFVKNHPKAIERFLQALIQAEEYLQKNPERSKDLLVKKFKFERPYIDSIWSEHNYGVSLHQGLLLTMEDETRWRIENQLTDRVKIPNYLDFIYIDALKAVKPESVTIIK